MQLVDLGQYSLLTGSAVANTYQITSSRPQSLLIKWTITLALIRTLTWLTNSMEQSPSWEANNSSGSQEFPHILQNLNVQYHFYKSPPLDPVLSQMHPLHAFPLYFPNIHYNNIFPFPLHLGLINKHELLQSNQYAFWCLLSWKKNDCHRPICSLLNIDCWCKLYTITCL